MIQMKIISPIFVQKIGYWNSISLAQTEKFHIRIIPEAGGRLMIDANDSASNIFFRNHAVEGQLSTPGSMEGYLNAGGGVFWIAPQNLWGWPPPGSMEGKWAVELKGSVAQLRSPSLFHGVNLRQELSVTTDLSLCVRSELRLHNTGIEPTLPLSIWRVFQYVPGGKLSVLVDATDVHDVVDVYPDFHGYTLEELLENNILRLENHHLTIDTSLIVKGSVKFGVRSAQTAYTYTLGEQTVVHRFEQEPEREAQYPHGKGVSSVEFYFDPGNYFEGELLTSLKSLKSQQSLEVLETITLS